MQTLDLRKEFKALYSPPTREPVIVEVPPLPFLMIDGAGNPNTSQEYRDAVSALYSLAYTLKFSIKKSQALDYPVMPLQGLWWAEDMTAFSAGRKDDWYWTMMIMQPEIVTPELVARAAEDAARKKPLPALPKVRLDRYDEGLSAQIMHIGPYAAEAPTIEKLHRFIADNGYTLRGKHHEIYLGDPGRGAPEKLKTVIRQPIR
jgi:hypothetical protein